MRSGSMRRAATRVRGSRSGLMPATIAERERARDGASRRRARSWRPSRSPPRGSVSRPSASAKAPRSSTSGSRLQPASGVGLLRAGPRVSAGVDEVEREVLPEQRPLGGPVLERRRRGAVEQHQRRTLALDRVVDVQAVGGDRGHGRRLLRLVRLAAQRHGLGVLDAQVAAPEVEQRPVVASRSCSQVRPPGPGRWCGRPPR